MAESVEQTQVSLSDQHLGLAQNCDETDLDTVDVRPDIVVSEVDVGQPCLACGEKCPGFAHHDWRNVCVNCKCVRELHDLYNDNLVDVRDRLGWPRDDGQGGVARDPSLTEGYTWVPGNLSSQKIHEYMEQLPNHKVPRVDTPGERYRDIQLIRQLPKQDLSDLYCRFLEDETERKEFTIFRELRDQVAMGIGTARQTAENTSCYSCKGVLERGDLVVAADKLGREWAWHPACFTCATCEELLVDLVYCQHGRQLYCQRHYAELIRPRCPSCDEVSGAAWSGCNCCSFFESMAAYVKVC
ncbi:prickle planar cell polarity protein 3-like [Aplysia californica]|uniref:Prickle planar cell polarity protein 3-like n=1 Tax=Aplysia californica TaxID=6500 RepID=A0ABM1VXX2_APLCA|nr:prickle planar cell polarity protein 3-like [Aplysia californica]